MKYELKIPEKLKVKENEVEGSKFLDEARKYFEKDLNLDNSYIDHMRPFAVVEDRMVFVEEKFRIFKDNKGVDALSQNRNQFLKELQANYIVLREDKVSFVSNILVPRDNREEEKARGLPGRGEGEPVHEVAKK